MKFNEAKAVELLIYIEALEEGSITSLVWDESGVDLKTFEFYCQLFEEEKLIKAGDARDSGAINRMIISRLTIKGYKYVEDALSK